MAHIVKATSLVNPQPQGDTPAKATFAKTGGVETRCSGKLRCDCGTRPRALDIEVEELDTELDEEPGIKRARAICPSCGSDWFEIAAS